MKRLAITRSEVLYTEAFTKECNEKFYITKQGSEA